MEEYAIYLRKSRADLEAEARGEGETLARHRAALTALADRCGYHVARIYQEIASGDTIAARPQMQALLSAVQQGAYAGVIVNDADRLARGNGADQALISQAFVSTGTLIITPFKVYDPSSPQDEDFFDFSLFMARFEYKQIKRRMQTGRARSAAEGNYQSGPAPYGYSVVKNQARSGYTLEIIPQQAEVVRLIYSWYVAGDGKNTIAHRLNDMGCTTAKGMPWIPSSVWVILKSRVYIGDYVYKKHRFVVTYEDGVRRTHREKNDSPIVVEGCFPAIVDRALWDRAQAMLSSHESPAVKYGVHLANPLSGLARCALCGRLMTGVWHSKKYSIGCRTPGCPTVGCYMTGVEDVVLDGLRAWVRKYEPLAAASAAAVPASAVDPAGESAQPTPQQQEADALRRQLDALNTQLPRLYDFLEQGIYDPQTFVARRAALEEKISALTSRLESLASQPTEAELIVSLLPQIHTVLDAYPLVTDAAEKNRLLKSVLSGIEYTRTHDARGRFSGDPATFVSLHLLPLHPRQ